MTMTQQFADMMSSSFSKKIAVFLLTSLVTGSSLMSISLLVLELRKFSFINDQKSGNRKYCRLSFSNIWKLGEVEETKFGNQSL